MKLAYSDGSEMYIQVLTTVFLKCSLGGSEGSFQFYFQGTKYDLAIGVAPLKQ